VNILTERRTTVKCILVAHGKLLQLHIYLCGYKKGGIDRHISVWGDRYNQFVQGWRKVTMEEGHYTAQIEIMYIFEPHLGIFAAIVIIMH
jgi:hypothetical protein